MKLKRILSAICAAAMAVSATVLPVSKNRTGLLLSVKASAASYTNEEFEYTEYGDGSVVIEKYIGSGGDVVIPAMIEDKTITGIGSDSFANCTGITSITVSDGISAIGDRAFSGCTNLKNAVIPGSVRWISSMAFYNCRKLESVDIAEGVYDIGYAAFQNCIKLKNIVLPSTITDIPKNTFENTKILNDQTGSLKYVGDWLVYASNDIIRADIKEGTRGISASVFAYCVDLESVKIPDKVKCIPNNSFYGCSSLTEVDLPDDLERIDWDSFSGCTGLTNIYIPEKVMWIDSSAFSGCSGIINMDVSPDNSTYTSIDGVVYKKDLKQVIYCPKKKKNVVIADSVDTICMAAFSGCSELTDVVIPEGVTTIEYGAFAGCTSLKSIVIPDTVTSLGDSAFFRCSAVEEVSIPDSITTLGKDVFAGCSSLKSVVIPDSVTFLDTFVFYECTSLSDVTIGNSVTKIDDCAFADCSSLTSITLPDSFTAFGSNVFQNCKLLKSINVSESNNNYVTIDGILYDKEVTHIAYAPEGITKIVIPDSVTRINDYTFSRYSRLTEVYIPDGVTYIGISSFFMCGSLETVRIPDAVEVINREAFLDCESLKEMTLSKNVSLIDEFAFWGCEALTDVYYDDTIEQWNAIQINAANDSLLKAKIHCSDGDIIPPHTHDYVFVLTESATCTQPGEKIGTCTFCGDTIVKTIPEKGHSWDFGKINKESTCTEDGEKQFTCKVCGETRTESIPAAGHKFTDRTVSPTYDSQGYTEHTCSVCGYSYKDSYTPKKQRMSIANATVTVAATSVYTGKALTPTVTVKLNGKTLTKGTDYAVVYKSNTNCGKATVTVTGKGSYTGTKSGSFIIKPKKVTANKLTSPKTKQIKVTWTKAAGGVTGYEVQIATNSKFTKGKKSYTVAKASAASKTITKLKKGTKYYARVRAYKTVGKTKYYGAWSAVKNVKCK